MIAYGLSLKTTILFTRLCALFINGTTWTRKSCWCRALSTWSKTVRRFEKLGKKQYSIKVFRSLLCAHMSKTWIQSRSGLVIEPRDPDPKNVRLQDIAHALALNNRFTFQTKEPFSVAQHCVQGARFIQKEFKLAFLMHETSECYIPDIAGPLKPFLFVTVPWANCLVSWKALEARHEAAILEGLGMSALRAAIHDPIVKAMDLSCLAWEQRDLLGPAPIPWETTEGHEPPTTERIKPWPWRKAKREWLKAFVEYGGKWQP